MKIALIAMSRPQHTSTRVEPPLPLSYLAALLEQQRCIIRIYDLALPTDNAYATTLAPLRMFRPHLVVLAAEDCVDVTEVEAALTGINAPILRLHTSLREDSVGLGAAGALPHHTEPRTAADEQSVMIEALHALMNDLDALPFPARHLLALEKYPVYTPKGDLQTPVFAAQELPDNRIVPRQTTQVLAEIESVIGEYGIRHLVFPEPFTRCSGTWLHEMLQQLIAAKLDIGWEARVHFEQFDANALWLFQQAGCEVLGVTFSAGDVLEFAGERTALAHFVGRAHELGVSVRGQIALEPPFRALASLLDLAATFELDAVSYTVVPQGATTRPTSANDAKLLVDVMKSERSRRSRQLFVHRFGPQLGPMLWHVGRAGLLGPGWRRYASGDDGSYMY